MFTRFPKNFGLGKEVQLEFHFYIAGNYMFKVNNMNITRCEIYSKLTIKTPERRHFLILTEGLLVILIDCMIFLSPFLDAARMSMSTASFFA